MALAIIQLDSANPRAHGYAAVIHKIITDEVNLSQRSLREIRGLIAGKEVLLLLNGDEIVSFLFLTPLDKKLMEIHSMYTLPQYRGQGYMSKLLEHSIRTFDTKFFAVTFHEHTEKLLSKFSFKKVPFAVLSASAKFTFVVNRAKLHRILSVVSFMKKRRPIYLLKSD
ncbi:MAG: hypothetical protein A2677_00445 [Candidatus Komeilibacteria bacterium RIFCSPHIGHO2_01_FULL_52_14]|uniref:N-acetyltransferase domain-containing protein n=1 Tax=Candidatus Komeilibacteria bacterium RIFCSPHIGHO2_01_FULL_52_14 TaxID=1798549 RepID=A0A1G2BM29_9BACT|nr:MAG: hypothetical protein A2677_00445 [Candidatus Komeilibacteria bacterium RIFCSPHIGHO2_01_FULL_52_14]